MHHEKQCYEPEIVIIYNKLTVHSLVLVIVKGLEIARNPPGPSLNVTLLPPVKGVKRRNPVVGAVSTDALNCLNKNLNLVSHLRGPTL